ncbi:alpha/beta fold hydrolase [Rhodoferax sp.]|uniref:alpha/beta fold hydrolase n=1 Tax=Rhodoferax sp. TaxID=50421 RepID=UPI0026338128|nr:alpha/beta fold hydrolase [Rhodoferax sp.]MDD3936026.1 alpha/beta fold hydrolase [Rhodoferax sp.]
MRFNLFQRNSLKTRVTLFSLAIFLLNLWALAFYASHSLRQDMQRMLGEQQLSTVALVANGVNLEVTTRLQALQTVAAKIGQELIDQPGRLQSTLEERPVFQELFNGGTFVTGLDGVAMASVHTTTDRRGVAYLDRDYVAGALKQGRASIGRPVVSKTSHVPILGMAVPIPNAQGQVIGALAGVINLALPGFLDGITRSQYGQGGGYVLVAPQYRIIVTASDKARIMEVLPPRGTSPTIDRFFDGTEGTEVFVNLLGVEVLASVKRVPVADWYIGVTLPTYEAFAPIQALQQRMLLAASLLTLLAGALTWWLLRRQMAPLEATAQTLAALADQRQALHTLPVTRADEVGQVIHGFNRLLTDLVQQQQGLKESEERYRTAFQTIPDAVTITRLSDGSYLEANDGFTRLFGWTRDEVLGKTSHDLGIWHNWDHRKQLMDAMQKNGQCENLEAEFVTKDGKVLTTLVSANALPLDGEPCMLAVTHDITQRKLAQDQIHNLAFNDPLTGLSNRRLLMDRLQQALVASVHQQRQGALLLVDLDGFKSLNETLGHDKGDALLLQVAKHLLTCVHEGDTVARLGGDEFVILLEYMARGAHEAATQAEAVGEKILQALNQPYPFDGSTHHSTASIGVTLFGAVSESAVEPLKRAELAMYQAKAAGRNTLRFYDPQMQAAVSARVALEAALRDALLKEQFILHYQMQVSGTNQILGVEALLRWRDPRRGMVSPAEFIPVAEESGLILPMGQWVIEVACDQLVRWAASKETDRLTIAVNVSARQFHQPDFVDQVLAALARSGANADRLKLELTESLLVLDIEGVVAKMKALKGVGVGFSLDDFGTGYSSLSFLKRLPLDQLKIDQSFVRGILLDPDDAAIAKTVITLADSLGLSVMAEGVETEAQRDFLANLGCHNYQGYLFGRPQPIDELELSLIKMKKMNDPIHRNNVVLTGNLNAARTIVFVHGFGTDQNAWKDVAAPFMTEFRIILLDNMGAGQSDPAYYAQYQHRYLNIHGYANDLLDVCKELQLVDAIAIGHSSGAMACLLATVKEPKRFSRLVLIGASPRYLDAEGYRGGLTKDDIDQVYQSVTSNYSSWLNSYAAAMMANPDRPDFTRRFIASIQAIPKEQMLVTLCAILQTDHRSEVSKLDKPTLIIQTRVDSVVPLEVAEYLHQNIKNSQLRVIDADGHLPHISAPDEVIAALRDFVNAQE